jgi:K(+)-stimulated pyrophosphate-energized sodium pump
MNAIMIYLPIAMVLTTIYIIKRSWVLKQDPGDEKMKEISDYITKGFSSLKAECLLTFL